MPSITDEEFGTVKLVRNARATYIRIKIGTDGGLRVSMPMYTPVILVKKFIHSSRTEIRSLLADRNSTSIFTDTAPIGKSHRLIIRPTTSTECTVSKHGLQIIVSLPDNMLLEDTAVQSLIRPVVIEALRKEAKSYLPRRLSHLAETHGFSYQKVRFSHAAGRWGSCSSSGTISLNIALMKLPFHLIDYVLIHELSHTKELNHSQAFWLLVAQCDPEYSIHKAEMKSHAPSV